MTTQSIQQIVAKALEGATKAKLEDIYYHGIHNVTNRYNNSDSDEEHAAWADEFERQAGAALQELERAEQAENRVAE